jgi:ribosomal protein L29
MKNSEITGLSKEELVAKITEEKRELIKIEVRSHYFSYRKSFTHCKSKERHSPFKH